MKYVIIFLFTAFSLTSCKENSNDTAENSLDSATTVYYLIRHAEKATGSDPELTEEGVAHAAFWADFLSQKNISAVYSTNTRRTMATAQPTAVKFDLEIDSYSPQEGFSQRLKEETQGKNVLFVGHSNTIPFLANAILGRDKFEEIDEKNYDNIYIVTVQDDKATAKKIRINNWDRE